MPNNICKYDEISVHVHISTYQNIIQRMATNSTNSKTWCVSIIAAIIALSISKDQYSSIKVAYIPLFLFCFLDTYYLSLEKAFRAKYNDFVTKLHQGTITSDMLFEITTKSPFYRYLIKSFFSLSIFPFYALTAIIITILLS